MATLAETHCWWAFQPIIILQSVSAMPPECECYAPLGVSAMPPGVSAMPPECECYAPLV